MEDIYVKCCRCKNKHWHSERKESAPDKYGMKTLTCPRCGGDSYYKLDDPAARTRYAAILAGCGGHSYYKLDDPVQPPKGDD